MSITEKDSLTEYEDPPERCPPTEVFYWTKAEASEYFECEVEDTAAGWYWWYCRPGCLPDCEAVGPFETEEEAQGNIAEDWEMSRLGQEETPYEMGWVDSKGRP